MTSISALSRRDLLAALGTPLLATSHEATQMRGAFIIAATPYTADKTVDYDDLAAEVDFLNLCGVQGIVWPQLASEFRDLTMEERMRGMEVLAKANQGKQAALVLGVQGDDTEHMLRYAKHAENLKPDAVIALPPQRANSLDDFGDYYRALCRVAKRRVFIQTSGGAKGIEPTVDFIVELAQEFENFGYVKEEHAPVIERMQRLAKHRPSPIKAVFSGAAGKGWPYEMRLGLDGTMPGAMFADVYALLWELHQRGDDRKLREVFSKLLVMINMLQVIPATRHYILKRRGVFKTTVSRRRDGEVSTTERNEIEWNLAALKPYLRVALPSQN